MSSNFMKEFCSRLLIFLSASFVPGCFGMFQTRYPTVINMFDPKFMQAMIGILGLAFLLRLGGLNLRENKESLWIAFFETFGYGIASVVMVLFWLPTRYPDFLNATFTEQFWTKHIYVVVIIEFLIVCVGVLMTLSTFKNKRTNARHSRKNIFR